MHYIKETTCAQPALQPLNGDSLWTGISEWVALRTAPLARWTSAASRFSADLRATDPLLFHLGWIMQALIPAFTMMAFASHVSGVHAAGVNPWVVNPWIKPMKFATSFSTFLWTISPMLTGLRMPAWQRKFARQAIAFGAIMEMVFLSAQAWRAAYVSGGAAGIDALLARAASAMISLVSAVCLGITVLYFVRSRVELADNTMVTAIRIGLVIFMIGNAVGGYMLARGSFIVLVGTHTDGAHGMPFTNWSTVGGDLRIAHFIAIHAIQILPLLVWGIRELRPSLPEAGRRLCLDAASALLLLAVTGTFVQAAMGHPLLPFGKAEVVARK